MSNREQVSVPLPAELRAWVRERAQIEDRSEAWVIRRCVAEARRQQPADAEAVGERAA
jgi:hypothetical protein